MKKLLARFTALFVGLAALVAEEEVLTPEPPAVPEEHFEAYFGGRPEGFLVDPQGLLAPDERDERERFLDYHSKDSAIDFHVLLFDEGQQVPRDVRTEELAERFFGEGKPSLLALYFLGEPERVRIQLSPTIADLVSPAELGRLRAQAVQAAGTTAVGADQLEDFCVQMAIGIFWIEREAGLGGGPDEVEPQEERSLPEPEPSRTDRMREQVEAWWKEWGLPTSVMLGVALIAWISRTVLRARARYRFPESLPPPRLGADHGAGTGALIDFRSSTRSPSSQKGGPNDSLGGI